MNRRRNTALALIGALLLTLTMSVPQAAAQAGGSKQIITGQTVTWTAGWVPETDVSIADQDVELLALSRGASIVGYGGTSFPVGANQLRDILLEGFETESTSQQIDRGDYDNVSYSIDLSTSEGVTLAIFTLVIENPSNTTMALLLTSPSNFATAMTDAQAGVTIDGAPIFDGVDAAQMQATIDAANPAGQTSGTTETPAPAPSPTPATVETQAPAPSPTAESGNGGLGDLGSAINGGQTTPDPQGQTDPTPAGQSTASGPANVHVIPANGLEVRYSDEWTISSSDDSNVRLQASSQPVIVSIVWATDDLPKMSEPRGFANSMVQTETFAGATVVDAVTVESGARWLIVLSQVVEGQELYFVIEVTSQPTGGATLTSVITPATNLPSALQAVPASIQIAGQPPILDAASHVPALQSAGT